MTRLWWVFGVLAVAASAVAQGGQGGGGFGGGQGGFGGGGQGQGQGGAAQGQGQDGSDGQLRGPFPYLNQAETTSILTPGEYVEWTLDLKQGQVVIAEARSEAFDPALEIVEGEKVLMDNDDRYPGDQRPLLLWSCPKDGQYLLRIRSFRGRAGGQVFSRHVVLDCQDLAYESKPMKAGDGDAYLYRLTLKQGEYVQAHVEFQGGNRMPLRAHRISPVGLPYADLVPGLARAAEFAICAPVDGEYYLYVDGNYARSFSGTSSTLTLRRLTVEPIASIPTKSRRPAGLPAIWSLDMKKGDFIELDGSTVSQGVYFSPAPDFTKLDPKAHPFAPKPAQEQATVVELGTRGSGRSSVGILALSDTKIWVGSSGSSVIEPTLDVRRASSLMQGGLNEGRMRISHIQWWAFEASAGDVIKLTTRVNGFASRIDVRSPDLQVIESMGTNREEDRTQAVFVARQTGRYLISVSCVGHGGTGSYSVEREVVPAQTLDYTSSLTMTLNPGEVKVFKITMLPGPVKLLKLGGVSTVQITDFSGQPHGMTEFRIGTTRYYHALFTEPTSYLVVLRGNGFTYRLSFVDPP